MTWPTGRPNGKPMGSVPRMAPDARAAAAAAAELSRLPGVGRPNPLLASQFQQQQQQSRVPGTNINANPSELQFVLQQMLRNNSNAGADTLGLLLSSMAANPNNKTATAPAAKPPTPKPTPSSLASNLGSRGGTNEALNLLLGNLASAVVQGAGSNQKAKSPVDLTQLSSLATAASSLAASPPLDASSIVTASTGKTLPVVGLASSKTAATGAEADTSYIPCRARGLPLDHNFKTACFTIPNDIKHGAHLVCSYPQCRDAGVKFRWCDTCKAPVAKRNFQTRHDHSKGGNVASEGASKSVQSTAKAPKNKPPRPAAASKKAAKTTLASKKKKTAVKTQAVSSRRSSGSRQESWAALLDKRPPVDAPDAMNAWLMQVLAVSDPDFASHGVVDTGSSGSGATTSTSTSSPEEDSYSEEEEGGNGSSGTDAGGYTSTSYGTESNQDDPEYSTSNDSSDDGADFSSRKRTAKEQAGSSPAAKRAR